MTPVDQLLRSELGEPGDCWRTCVATLLDLAPADVPHFMLDADGALLTEGDAWRTATEAWCAERGLELREVAIDYERGWLIDPPAERYAIVSGETRRGLGLHAVVGDLQRLAVNDSAWLVHDPHPSRAGLVTIADAFVILNPPTPRAMTARAFSETVRWLADQPHPLPPIELVSRAEASWRRARPGSTHLDYLLATNAHLRRRWNDRWRALRRSRRNQPARRRA